VVGLLLVLKFGERPKSATSATNAPTSAADQKSIAVLPFVNMSADKADEYPSDVGKVTPKVNTTVRRLNHSANVAALGGGKIGRERGIDGSVGIDTD